MSDYGSIGDGLVGLLIGACIFCFVIGTGGYFVIDKFVINHDIMTETPLKPVIKPYYNEDTKRLDTIYVYKRP